MQARKELPIIRTLTLPYALSVALLPLLAISSLAAVRARFLRRTPVRSADGCAALMSISLAATWVARIISDFFIGTAPTRVDMVVWPMDLVIAFPALFWGGIWLHRRTCNRH